MPKDILVVVDKDDNAGDDGMLMMVMLKRRQCFSWSPMSYRWMLLLIMMMALIVMVSIIMRHDDAGGSGAGDDGYAQTQVVFFLVTYVVPMVGLSITYFHLGYVLWAAPNMRWGWDDDDKHG